ncbi:glycerate kinase [Kocuria nitroreducens]|uniref:glycerate kinase n=1 Tax=Kocuria nitroreducens TaxID=3058914 RepID=UPI0036DD8AEE
MRARWAVLTAPSGATTAVIESARASGLDQVRPSPVTARAAHSYGCGQLIRAALDAALRRWAGLLAGIEGARPFLLPGAGAAGGFPAPTPATLERGFDLVSSLVGLEEQLQDADLLVVGEGSLDLQSLQGKAPLAAAALAAARGVPVVAVAGRLALSEEQLLGAGSWRPPRSWASRPPPGPPRTRRRATARRRQWRRCASWPARRPFPEGAPPPCPGPEPP